MLPIAVAVMWTLAILAIVLGNHRLGHSRRGCCK
jgi:hypothetical protein